MALVSVLHAPDVARGWHEDDHGFLRLDQHRLSELWRFDLGWFYRPVFLSWFWLMLKAVGDAPRVFHIASLITHALNACLLGLLVLQLSRRPWPAAGATLVFVLSMKGNQAVWWVSAASTTLVALFMLLALIAWARYLHRPRPVWYLLSLLACALAMGSKEEAVVLVLAMVLMELLISRQRPWRRALVGYIPFAALMALWMVLALHAHAAYVRGPADFMDYDARSYVEAVNPTALPERLPFVLGALDRAWHGVLPLFPVSAAGLLGLGSLVICLRRDRPTLWFVAWLGLMALPSALTLSWQALSGRFIYAPTMAGTASGLLALAVLDPRRSWTGKAILAAAAMFFVPGDLRIMRDFYLGSVTTDLALVTAIDDWAALALALGGAIWMWRARRIAASQLAMIAAMMAATVLIAVTPKAWEQAWWLAAMFCWAAAMRRTGWWHGALSALVLLPQAGTALPLFVIALATMQRCEDETEAASRAG